MGSFIFICRTSYYNLSHKNNWNNQQRFTAFPSKK